jgi:hypothetical protein
VGKKTKEGTVCVLNLNGREGNRISGSRAGIRLDNLAADPAKAEQGRIDDVLKLSGHLGQPETLEGGGRQAADGRQPQGSGFAELNRSWIRKFLKSGVSKR